MMQERWGPPQVKVYQTFIDSGFAPWEAGLAVRRGLSLKDPEVKKHLKIRKALVDWTVGASGVDREEVAIETAILLHLSNGEGGIYKLTWVPKYKG